jgi:hypothetical protein
MATKIQTSAEDMGYKSSATPSLTGVVAGRALYCYIGGFLGTTPATAVSFSDDKGNTWAQAQFQSSVSKFSAIGYCENVTTGGTVTVTATPTGGTGTIFVTAVVIEYSGMLASGSLDKTTGQNYNGGSVTAFDTTATAVTTQAGELYTAVYAAGSFASDPTVTDTDATGAAPASGWVLDLNGGSQAEGVKLFIVSVFATLTEAAKSAITVSTGAGSFAACLATFKEASSSPMFRGS